MDEPIDVENLDYLIKIRFTEILDDVRPEKKKLIHPKSVRNIIYHLIDKPKKRSEAQYQREYEIKKKLLIYLKTLQTIKSTELTYEKSRILWNEHLKEIAQFMSKYYDFSYVKGCCGVVFFLLIMISVDIYLMIKHITNFPYLTIYTFISLIIEKIIQIRQKKHYAAFY